MSVMSRVADGRPERGRTDGVEKPGSGAERDASQSALSKETSRVIVKNLPKYITEEQVRKHFSTRGYTITDLKLMKTVGGRFRRFAFVGFASAGEAADCQQYFDKTYLDTSRLDVALALSVGDPNLPRAWSRYSAGSSAYVALHPEQSDAARKKIAADAEQERRRQEQERQRKFLFSIYGAEEATDNATEAQELDKFMSAMRPKSKTRTWENDDDGDRREPGGKKQKRVDVKVSSVRSKKTGGEGVLLPKVHLKFAGDDEQADGPAEQIHFEGEEDADDALYEDFPPRGEREDPAEDNDAMFTTTDTAEDSIQNLAIAEDTTTHPFTTLPTPAYDLNSSCNLPADHERAKSALSPDMIAESGRLFVRNLSYLCTEADLTTLFSQFGPLSQVHMPISRDTKRPKGMAYILFMLPADAVRAYSALDGTIFQGRLLHVLPAYDAKESKTAATGGTFRDQRERELRANSNNPHTWNALFIRADTVLDAIAARLGVAKSAIMNAHESDSLATRLAVAETHIIQETRAYLEGEGVCLDVFSASDRVERSSTVMLVKNLPFVVEAPELRTLFARWGTLGRVVLPPVTRSIALVEFLEASEARAAFRHLAYSNFHGAPLLLEWAPVNVLKAAAVAALPVELKQNDAEEARGAHDAPLDSAADSSTLYVKNLAFRTDEETLRRVFSTIATIRSVRIPTKPSPTDATVPLSLGFGFVEFATREDVNRALDQMQGVQVDGHVLVLKRAVAGLGSTTVKSTRKTRTDTDVDETLRPTKLLIRNIPFEASERELRDLITSFTAALKRLRLPRKFDRSHRGFGFAEFTSHAEAKHLMETLSATHFYGRHLVIEWARLEESSVHGDNED